MELRHLRYFITVAEELHFGRAAERLNMTQPPLSQQIRQLEDELGVQLFNRVGRNIELSVAGRVFLEETQQTLVQVEHAVQAARRAARGEIGRLVVGFVGTAAYRVLPSTLRVFQERFPGVEVALREMTTLDQAKALRAEQMDVGFLRPPVDSNGLEIETVFREPLVVALRETHPLTVNEHLTLEMLAKEVRSNHVPLSASRFQSSSGPEGKPGRSYPGSRFGRNGRNTVAGFYSRVASKWCGVQATGPGRPIRRNGCSLEKERYQ
jgi:DNA-binding transcriptional LysR family regulator